MVHKSTMFLQGGGGSGVATLNGLSGAVTLTSTGGTVTITPSGSTIDLEATGGSGTVTAVTGTTNRITSSGGTTPAIDISASYVGQTSITTLGTVTTGTWSGLFGAVSGANLTNLTAANITAGGTAPINISGNSALTTTINGQISAGTNITLSGTGTVSSPYVISATGGGGGTVTSVSGTANRISSTGGTTPVIDIDATYVGQTSLTTLGTITTGVWHGTAIANANLANSSLTIGSTTIALGATSTTLAGLTSVASTGFTGALTGNASTATALATGRTISITGDLAYTSPTFDGTGNVTAAGTLATVNTNTGSFGSSTSIPNFTVNGKGLITAAGSNVVIAPAGTLSGTVLNSAVVSSSLTSVGTLVNLTVTNPISGSVTGNAATVTTNANLTGPITSVGNATTITNSVNLPASPTTTTQAPGDNSTKIATTAYVQAALFATDIIAACKYATTAALPTVVYVNGSSGVGATLTAVSFGAASFDGVTPSISDRILVKNQVSTFQNGIYTVTTVGTVGTVFVLTRATDYNQTADIEIGDTTFVSAGNTLANTTWAQNGTDSPVVGTDPITFTQTAGPGSYTAGNGILITGTSIAIDTSITIDKTTAQTLTNKTLTSPIFTAPALGTPASGNLVNTTGYTIANLSGAGTGVLTALAVNVGTAGAFVVNGGALGTPSSGVATNLTGTASGLTAGSVTNATLTTALTVNTGTVTLTGNAANTSVLTIGAGAVSVSGANTGDQNTFTSVVVSGQTTVTAASTSQALTFIAGTNITLTTDNTAKSVTITASGGSGTVTTTGTPANGNLTKFSGGTSITNGDLSGVVTTSGSLTTSFGSFTSATLAAAVSDETGSGALVFATSPSFTTPVLGTPSSGTLTSCTGYTVANLSGAGTGVLTALAVNVGTAGSFIVNGGALGTPSSGVATNLTGTAAGLTAGAVTTNANLSGVVTSSGNTTSFGTFTSATLAAAVSDETGTGALVFGTTPTIATPVLNGIPTGTGVATAATANTLALRDANGNITANNHLQGYQTTATASGTTTLTVSSGYIQVFTGSVNQILVLPVASTVVLGQSYLVINDSAGSITVESSGGSIVVVMSPSTSVLIENILTSGTTQTSWRSTYSGYSITSGKVLKVSNSLTLTGTDGSSVAFGTGGTVAYTSNNLSVFAATTSAQLAGVISDETGTGALVFGTSPTMATVTLTGATTSAAINASGDVTVNTGTTAFSSSYISTNASVGGSLTFAWIPATPAIGNIAGLAFNSVNASSVQKVYAEIFPQVAVNTAGAEVGSLAFYTSQAGTLSQVITMKAALTATLPLYTDSGKNLISGSPIAKVNSTNLAAAVTATTIYAVPAAGAGMYRLSWCASITRAATSSCALGGSVGFGVIYTDVNDSVVKTYNPTSTSNMVSIINATGTTVSGCLVVYAKASTNIQYTFGYTSVGATTMQYDLNIVCEPL